MKRASWGIVAGCSFLGSLQAAGLDPTFGTNGRQTLEVGGSSFRFVSAILQSDGRIVAVGYTPGSDTTTVPIAARDMLVVRFTANGALDTTFSGDGIATIDFAGNDDRAGSIRQQADGKLLVGGETVSSSGDGDMAIVRLLSDGTVDSTFKNGGKYAINCDCDVNGDAAISTTAYGNDRVLKLELQPDGRVLLGGAVCADRGGKPAVVRLLSDGNVDATYGVNGLWYTYVPGGGMANSMLLHANGQLFVGTVPFTGSFLLNAQGAVVRSAAAPLPSDTIVVAQGAVLQHSDGRYFVAGLALESDSQFQLHYKSLVYGLQSSLLPNTSFGTNGYVKGLGGSNDTLASSLLSEPAGKILVGGYAARAPGLASLQDAVIYRFDPSGTGTSDTSFGTNGVLTLDLSGSAPGYASELVSLLRAADGKLIVIANRGIPADGIGGRAFRGRAFQVDSQRGVVARVISTPEFNFTQSAVTASESGTSVVLTVTRTGTTANPVSINYSTSAGSAAAGSDFATATGTLTWSASDTDSKSVTITSINDSTQEFNEDFSVQLSNPSEGSIGTGAATVTITDDDATAGGGGGGGGGGATGPLTLLVLSALGLARRRRRT